MAWREDAIEFGRYVKQGGWRLGLLVARNCMPGEPHASKVTVNAFAAMAGLSARTVLLHLRAWELAAEDNIVPHAITLGPGSEPRMNLGELPEWRQYYRSERALAGRAGSVELHPDPAVMARRMAARADAPQIAHAVSSALPAPAKAQLADRLAQEVEQAHAPEPAPAPEPRRDYVVVESVQRVLNDLEQLARDADRLPPLMTTQTKSLLATAAREALPVIEKLAELDRVPLGAPA